MENKTTGWVFFYVSPSGMSLVDLQNETGSILMHNSAYLFMWEIFLIKLTWFVTFNDANIQLKILT